MSAQRKKAITVVKAETRQRLADLDDAEEYDEALLNSYRECYCKGELLGAPRQLSRTAAILTKP